MKFSAKNHKIPSPLRSIPKKTLRAPTAGETPLPCRCDDEKDSFNLRLDSKHHLEKVDGAFRNSHVLVYYFSPPFGGCAKRHLLSVLGVWSKDIKLLERSGKIEIDWFSVEDSTIEVKKKRWNSRRLNEPQRGPMNTSKAYWESMVLNKPQVMIPHDHLLSLNPRAGT